MDPFTMNKVDYSIGLNPKKMLGFTDALKTIKKDVLDNPDFFLQEPEVIVDFLIKIHAQACKYYVDHDGNPIKINEYRDTYMIVFDEEAPRDSMEGMINYAKEKGASKKELRHLKTAIKKITDLDSFEAIEQFSRNEKSAFHFLGGLPPDPAKISDLMLGFASNLKNKFFEIKNGKIHPIALAAWTHQQIAKIHPFQDGNGLNARLWMNTILELGGYESVIFDSDDNYTAAFKQDADNTGAFASYLAKMVKQSRLKTFA